MNTETRLLVIKLLEGFTEGVRNGTFNLSDKDGRFIADTLRDILNPQPKMNICNITMACSYLGISQPTFRKYIKQGKIPEGKKVSGFTELIWDKDDIERFKKSYKSK